MSYMMNFSCAGAIINILTLSTSSGVGYRPTLDLENTITELINTSNGSRENEYTL